MDSINFGELMVSVVVLYFAIFICFAKFTISLPVEQCPNINLVKADRISVKSGKIVTDDI